MEIYICKHCGNVVTKLTDHKVPLVCCGEKMQMLEAGVTDAAQEKHVPAFIVKDQVVTVQVGSVEHPMVSEHWIEWVIAETNQGALIKWLKPEEAPKAVFALADGEELKAVWAYCNIHGLWKADA